jgi:hypothetical protein
MTKCDLVWIWSDKCSCLSTLPSNLTSVANHLESWLIKNLARLVDAKTRYLWIKKDDQDPANEANCSVKAEGTRRC